MAAFYDWAEGEALGDQHRTVHNELGYIKRGTGSPEGVLTADIGSLFIRSDGGTSTVLYVKESGSGNTGWVALGSIASIDHGTLTGLTDDDHPQYALDTDLTTHAGAADPHTGYRLESADHSHASAGAQAGQLDHGTALTGLSDDDHPQYMLESLIDAVGDLIVGSAADTPARLAKGTTGQHLITDTGETLDLKWESQTITIGAIFNTTLTVGDYIIWRVPFACTVTAVRGYVDTGTTTQFNAKKVGTGDFCSADITIDPSDAWEAGTVNQNTALSAGDTVAVEIVAAGTATQLTIQVEVTRP